MTMHGVGGSNGQRGGMVSVNVGENMLGIRSCFSGNNGLARGVMKEKRMTLGNQLDGDSLLHFFCTIMCIGSLFLLFCGFGHCSFEERVKTKA